MMDEKNIDLEPPVELPKPTAQKLPEMSFEQPQTGEKNQAVTLEQGHAARPMPFTAPTTAKGAPVTASQTPSSIPPATSSVASLPETADDGDLIEKEWVIKAKEIVERTKSDPYVQNREMSKVKAEYLKRRYNKDLKLSDK